MSKGIKGLGQGGVCRTACVKGTWAGVSRYEGKMLRGVHEVTKNDGECVNVWLISSLLFEWS